MNRRQRKKAEKAGELSFKSAARTRREFRPIWGDVWMWSQEVNHPQRILAQPRWRKRQWLRERNEDERRAAALLRHAPVVVVSMTLGGLYRRPVL